MKTLTVFTPTYNRKHTLPRTYESLCRQTCRDFDWLVIDDGSSDGTREWIESLGPKMISSGQKFDWMGRIVEGEDENHFEIQAPNVHIEYIYKPNGGLYTGYNVAYQTIQTELCVCVDSDDFMPDNAVEKIVETWKEDGGERYCGLIGLDYALNTKDPIGGEFPASLTETFLADLRIRRIHSGDVKIVARTVLMKNVCPMIGFEGEKNFNPIYMIAQVCDINPLLVLNDNLCWVDYQIGVDSMSQGIFKQYINSPRSFAKMRIMEMKLKRTSCMERVRSSIHYVSSCLLSKDLDWLKNSPNQILSIIVAPIGFFVYLFILYKTNECKWLKK